MLLYYSMEIINENENNNKCLFSCAKCKYNTKQEKNYEKHLLTAKHRKNSVDDLDGLKELFEKECKKSDDLQKELDDLKSKNSMLITKLLSFIKETRD